MRLPKLKASAKKAAKEKRLTEARMTKQAEEYRYGEVYIDIGAECDGIDENGDKDRKQRERGQQDHRADFLECFVLKQSHFGKSSLIISRESTG